MDWDKIDNAPERLGQSVKNCFSNYSKIRQDLEEKRIVSKAGLFNVELNDDYVLLCWALYLSNLFDCTEFSGIKEFAQNFQNVLEPIQTEDLRTEGLFLALQISAISPDPNISQDQLSQKRAALMLAWSNSHNASITDDRLSFWTQKDSDAYAQVVELEFEHPNAPKYEEMLIEPLARAWLNKGDQIDRLASRLKKWLLPTYSVNSPENRDYEDFEGHQIPIQKYDPQVQLSAAALSILSQRPKPQFLETLARCHETLARYESLDKNIGVLMRWGYTENVLENLSSLAERAQGDDELLLNGLYGLATNLNIVDLPMSLQRPLSEEDREWNAYIEEWNRSSLINRIRNQEQLLTGDSPEVNANRNYYGLDRLAIRKDLDGLCDEDQGEINRILHHVSTSTEPKLSRDLLPWIAKYAPENYSKFACDFKIDALNPEYPAYVLGQIQELVFEQIDCERITEAILEMKEGLVQENDSSRQRARLITDILLFSASGDKLIDWFKFLASHESLRKSIFTETLQVLLNKLLPESVVRFVQQKLKISQSSSFDNQFPLNIESEKITEEDFWWWIYLCICDNDENVGTWALENLKRRKSNVHSITFHSLCKATRDSNRFLSEVFTDENVRKHLFLKKGRFFTTPIYEGENSYSYEDLVSVLPQEIVGSYLCSPQRRADLSRWGKELMERLCSILQGPRVDFDYDREMRFRVNPKVLQTWAEQHTEEFSQLANKYFIKLSESPWYRQELRNFTNAIFCLLLRFQPDKARQYYHQWNMENSTTQYKATNFLHQLWQVKQCNSLKHHQFRRELLEACLNDEEIMFMSVIVYSLGRQGRVMEFGDEEVFSESLCEGTQSGCFDFTMVWDL